MSLKIENPGLHRHLNHCALALAFCVFVVPFLLYYIGQFLPVATDAELRSMCSYLIVA
jgi:hypothetical protein